MAFRLITVLYLCALLAASLAVFGVWGVVFAAAVFAFWNAWDNAETRLTLGGGCAVVVIGLVLLALLLPAVTAVRTPSLRTMSLNTTKQLLLAILNYESVHGHLPPPYVTDDEGTPLYSWRVAILPFIESESANSTYRQLHLDEPWDSPHNRPLLDQVDAHIFSSVRVRQDWEADGTTDYVAVVDSATVWPADTTVTLRGVADGTSNTIAIMEVGGLGIHWAEPRDVTLDEAIDLMTGQSSHRAEVVVDGYFTTEVYELGTRIVGFLDGHADAIGPLKHREDARALLTRAGREQIDGELDETKELYASRHIETIVNWDHIWGVAVWLALVLLPSMPAARRKIWPASKESETEEQKATELAETDHRPG